MEHVIGPPPVIAIQPVGRGRTQGAGHVDVIYILGPDSDLMEAEAIRKACANRQRTFHMIGDGKRRITESDIQDLHRSRLKGPDTHVILSGHGTTDGGDHAIFGAEEGDSKGAVWLTTHLLDRLLTDPDDIEPVGASLCGSGIIHVMACGAGSLKTEFTPDSKTWRKGWCLVHASTKSSATGTILPNAIAIIELLADCERRGLGAPLPQHVLATVVAVTGECVTLMGGTLNEAQTYHAPKSGGDLDLQNTLALAWRDHLENEIFARQGRPSECELKSDQSYKIKLQNTFLTRIRRGDVKAVRDLLAQDSSLAQATGADGINCLMYASDEGHLEIVNELIACGAKIDARDQNNMTALHHACRKGHAAVARRLVEHGADVNPLTKNNDTPLLFICANGDVELAKFLLVQKAKFDIPNADGLTPLMAAADEGVPQLVRLLLGNGADCNAADNAGDTALHHACHFGHAAVVTLLLQSKGVSKNVKNNAGFTPLFLAVRQSFEDIAAVLVDGGADLDLTDSTGRALIHLACAYGDQSLANLILNSRRANINIETPEGETPLSLACANRRHNYVASLVSCGADINLADNQGRTPLIRAALAASLRTTEALIAAHAKVNAQDKDGCTALMHACWINDYRTVSALLEAGASTRLRGVDGKSAFDLVQARLKMETRSKHIGDLKEIRSLLISAAEKDG